MTLKHLLSVGIILTMTFAALCGCASYKAEYKFEGNDDSPAVDFTSDFVLHTSLATNTTNTATNKCSDLKAVGYILKQSLAPFSSDEPNYLVTFKVPENRPIIVSAWAMIGASANSRTSCGPIAVRFTPRPKKIYTVNFANGGGTCLMTVADTDGEQVDTTYLPKCK